MYQATPRDNATERDVRGISTIDNEKIIDTEEDVLTLNPGKIIDNENIKVHTDEIKKDPGGAIIKMHTVNRPSPGSQETARNPATQDKSMRDPELEQDPGGDTIEVTTSDIER